MLNVPSSRSIIHYLDWKFLSSFVFYFCFVFCFCFCSLHLQTVEKGNLNFPEFHKYMYNVNMNWSRSLWITLYSCTLCFMIIAVSENTHDKSVQSCKILWPLLSNTVQTSFKTSGKSLLHTLNHCCFRIAYHAINRHESNRNFSLQFFLYLVWTNFSLI